MKVNCDGVTFEKEKSDLVPIEDCEALDVVRYNPCKGKEGYYLVLGMGGF
jgi:hypothetical protein